MFVGGVGGVDVFERGEEGGEVGAARGMLGLGSIGWGDIMLDCGGDVRIMVGNCRRTRAGGADGFSYYRRTPWWWATVFL